MNTGIKTYEIYCEKFSRIIQAETLWQAVERFDLENPFENIICAEDVEYKAQSAPAPVGEGEAAEILIKALEDIKNWNAELDYEWNDQGNRASFALSKFKEYASLNKPISSDE